MPKKYNLSFFSLLLIQVFAFAQTPCDQTTNFAGEYPCNDYDLLSRIPISTLATTAGTPEGSDIWGWTDPTTGKEYALVGTTNSTAFVDVTDPINPIFLGRIETASGTNFWRDVKVYNNYAFIVADGVGAHGMQVFDLSRLQSGVDPDYTYDADVTYTGDGGADDLVIGSCHNIVINESEGVAYLVGCGSANGGGPIFIDITNPMNPTTIGDYTDKGYTHDAQVVTYNGPDSDHTGKELLIGSNGNSDKVVILDVTNKTNITLINEFTYPQTAYAHQGWFTEDKRYFILGDEVDETSFGFNSKTLVFDFLDLDADFNNPDLLKTYFGSTTAIDHNGYIKGDEFFLSNYSAGMRVLDVPTLLSTNNASAETGYFDTHPESNGASFNGAWSVYPYFASENIVISDIERGLFIVRKKDNSLSVDTFQNTESFTLSPNPTTSIAKVMASTNKKISNIDIFNILGQNVFSKSNINKPEFVLPIENYSKGIYLVKINNTVTKKLVLK